MDFPYNCGEDHDVPYSGGNPKGTCGLIDAWPSLLIYGELCSIVIENIVEESEGSQILSPRSFLLCLP